MRFLTFERVLAGVMAVFVLSATVIGLVQREPEIVEVIEDEKVVMEPVWQKVAAGVWKDLRLNIIKRMPQKYVALTFDDGPVAGTEEVLNILKDKGAKATFFVVGYNLRANPGIARRIEAEGHEIGSHTLGHVSLSTLKTAEQVQAEVAGMNELFQEILGHEIRLMRPPYGAGVKSEVVQQNIGVPMINWSVDPEDWKYRDAATVRAAVRRAVFDGAVILLHDIHPSTVQAVAGIIDDLKSQGYQIVTVSELAQIRGEKLQAGQVYYSFKRAR